MIKTEGLNFCDACRERKLDVDFVKFPAVEAHMQYMEFCKPCRKKFYAWRKKEIKIQDVFNKDFKYE